MSGPFLGIDRIQENDAWSFYKSTRESLTVGRRLNFRGEFGSRSRLSCDLKPPGELLPLKGKDGQFVLGKTKPLCHRTCWQYHRYSTVEKKRIKPQHLTLAVKWKTTIAFCFFLFSLALKADIWIETNSLHCLLHTPSAFLSGCEKPEKLALELSAVYCASVFILHPYTSMYNSNK